MKLFLLSLYLLSNSIFAQENRTRIGLEDYGLMSMTYSSTRDKVLVGIVDQDRARATFAECDIVKAFPKEPDVHPYDITGCMTLSDQWIQTSSESVARFNKIFVSELLQVYAESESLDQVKLGARDGSEFIGWLVANGALGKFIFPRMIERGLPPGRIAATGYLFGMMNAVGIVFFSYRSYRDYYQPLPSLEAKILDGFKGYARARTTSFSVISKDQNTYAGFYDLIVQALVRALILANRA